MFKKYKSTVFKFFLISVCFLVIAKSFDLSHIPQLLTNVKYQFVIVAFTLLLSETFVMAIRYVKLFSDKNLHIGIIRLVRLLYVSGFLSSAIPSSFGQDAVRVIMLKNQKYSLTHCTSIMTVDRVLSTLSIIFFSFAGVLLVHNHIDSKHIIVFLSLTTAALFLFITLLFSSIPIVILKIIDKYSQGKIFTSFFTEAIFKNIDILVQFLIDTHKSITDFISKPKTLFSVFLWNCLTQIFRILQIYFLFLAVGYYVALHFQLAFVPIIVLVTMIPVTYFGIGVREGAFLYFFTSIGVPADICLTVSLLTSAINIAGIIPGVFLIWIKK
jgi:glycosyltransferase 2 family protein